ncbi:maackiain detoxification [Guyanagaster necrorhizus]|uniref:Maackiain detoxification n=1 Tax=Guyanagaster necrorhizus TaxID=856835 RepID=A0A9P8AV44_9AGAR|nr:maackiain detoxification [Guyanagaster necrorhizus MCA 3950]KAG7449149.1 maackiain detoxification [Guyanagaster necrorhizus MCA 3950]
MAENMVREPLSRIDILIAGGGLAGLTVAIECHRKGHNVHVVERRPGLDSFGDLIGIQPSALCTMRKWPGFVDQLYENQFGPDVHMYKFDGTLIGVFSSFSDYDPSTGERAVILSRLELHRALHKYATSLGISIQHGISVEHYSETIDKGCAILADGTKLEADLVIAAGGVGGKARSTVSGKKEQPISSGYTICRTTFLLEHAMKDPLLAKVYEGNGSHASAYIGPNTHIVTGKNKNIVCWVMTYLANNANATEDWSKTRSSDSALKHVKDWSPFVPALINAVPNKEVVDWKLMWRNPQPKWTSQMGRVAQIGDAAHSLLPTSGSGATMAMEDGFTLAACLHIGGRNNISLAVQVYNKLRFERVSCVQRMGFKTRENWHHTDWDALVGKIIGNWLAKHDSEKYAYDNYAACAKHITEGTPFANTNTPPGYTYEPWTVEDLLKAAGEKTDVQDAGDWS